MSDPIFRLVLPGLPPTVNHAYRPRARGGKVRNPEALAWVDGAQKAIRAAANVQGLRVRVHTALTLDLLFEENTLYDWDLDNLAKLLIDALCRALGLNDGFIVDLHLRKARTAFQSQTTIMLSYQD